MTNKAEFDSFIGQLLEHAIEEFKSTEQYNLLKEKKKQMDRDCDTMLRADEKEFAIECFELIMGVNGQEETYIYRKAFKDCVSVLKWMGVLA